MSRVLPLALSALLLAGCATTGAGRDPTDPHENFNRVVWKFNRGVDQVLLKPASSVYRTVTPKPARRGISRVFANLSEPFSAINAFLQGKPKRGLNSLGRFLINTTLGVGGLADHATGMGLRQTPEDFGQTLAAWGIKSSAYLVMPLLGPSTVRDGIGSGLSQFLDPYRLCLRNCGLPSGLPTALTATEIIDTRAQLTDGGVDAFLASSADPYAVARSAFFQRRAAQLTDQDGPAAPGPQSDDAAMDAALRELDAQNPGASPPAPGQPAPAPEANDPALDAALREIDAQQQSAPAAPAAPTSATPQPAAPSGPDTASPPPAEGPRLPFSLSDL